MGVYSRDVYRYISYSTSSFSASFRSLRVDWVIGPWLQAFLLLWGQLFGIQTFGFQDAFSLPLSVFLPYPILDPIQSLEAELASSAFLHLSTLIHHFASSWNFFEIASLPVASSQSYFSASISLGSQDEEVVCLVSVLCHF